MFEKKILFFIPLSLIIMMTTSCKKWRLTTLQPEERAFIPNGIKSGEIVVKSDDYGLKELSFNVNIFNQKICLVDNILKRIQILDSENQTKIIIGKNYDNSKEKIQFTKFEFSVLGLLSLDKDNNIYVQNKFPNPDKDTKKKTSSNNEDLDFSPSYVLVFNYKGKLQYTLGQEGVSSIPFYYLEKIFVDKTGQLFLVSRSFDSYKIYAFKGKKKIFSVNLGNLKFNGPDEQDYEGKIENVEFFSKNSQILISIAFYYNLRLKYRKIITYSIPKNKIIKTIMKIPDPKNVLFKLAQDQHIYFWNVEEKNEAKFIVSDLQGNIINNILLDLEGYQKAYSKIMTDELGNFFSYHVNQEGIQVLSWKE